ncbi:MAG: ABC transporter permease [Alphaproteobacteria bacterium]|jgi:NitT/TauT family transport system permease protein|nr:ABC transporter permease [Alphaproteobacteria bacterium]
MLPPDARPVPFRGGGFAPRGGRVAPLVAFILIIAAWEAASRSGILPALFLPAPSAVFLALKDLAQGGKLVGHVTASLYRIGIGWTIGALAGLVAGVAIGLFTLARAVGIALTSALFPIPKISLLPLLILWFGIGEPSKIATIAFGVFFPTVVSAYGAVDGVPKNLIRMGQSFGLSTAAIVWKIVLPGALPGILSGFRISTSIALILVVAAEMIGADKGIGAFILAAGNLMQTDQLLAGVVLLSLLGLAIAFVLGRIEAFALRWR